MNSCRTVRDLLEQARDERLPALIRSALDSHLGSCPDCARLAVLESALNESLASLREVDDAIEVPLDFRRQVKERLLASDRSSAPSRTRWASGFAAGLAAAACLAVLATAVFALRGGFESEAGPARVAATGAGPLLATPGAAARFDSRTAPLLYATPEVEVIFDDSRPEREDSQPLRAAAAAPDEDAKEPGSGRREYHF